MPSINTKITDALCVFLGIISKRVMKMDRENVRLVTQQCLSAILALLRIDVKNVPQDIF